MQYPLKIVLRRSAVKAAGILFGALGAAYPANADGFACSFNTDEWQSASHRFGGKQPCPREGGYLTSNRLTGSFKSRLSRLIKSTGMRADRFVAVEIPTLNNAVAFECRRPSGEIAKGIAWGPQFMNQLENEAGTSWASVAILAHEIAHHANSDTAQEVNLGSEKIKQQELYADRWAGHRLRGLGASRNEATAVFAQLGPGGDSHPPARRRVEAAGAGWDEGDDDDGGGPGGGGNWETLPANVCVNRYYGTVVCQIAEVLLVPQGYPCQCLGVFGQGIAVRY